MVDTPLACVNTSMVDRKLVCRVSYRRDELIDRKGSHKKVRGQTHRITNADRVIGNEPRINEEFTGWVNLNTSPVNVAYMRYPCGWVEPCHRLEFDDYSLVLRGALTVGRRDDG
jgi:hypothetical protein